MVTRTTVTHWVLIGLAFFFIPAGTVALSNPFFESRAPLGDDARRVVYRVLWDTTMRPTSRMKTSSATAFP
jgi:hypothetical protein